ncbi:KpsF/GutQ family sugar-phosphate isomerase [Microbacterium invictum]|uniref:Arabinose-5-phosphate isomerase n=1 Tax=Microbacterium invictum TaxID=515415 RepID=A0AA40VNC2_9MICO|nr:MULTISPECIES: SIS domain-containing protein [Microbacterium]MBB4140674.1 arabinose-5-phosphate isomerase [Microbacterium invictum]
MSTNSTLLDAARLVVRNEGAAVLAVADQIDETFIEVVDLLENCRGKVFVTGSGTSGAVARRMAHLLAVCGTPSVFIHPMDALHGTMGALAPGDVLISISRGGESSEINDFSTRAQRRSVKVVAITAAPSSSLGRLADLTVTLATEGDGDPGGVIAMGSTLVTAVWGDALANILMRRRGYGWDQVLETHPAGAVGLITDLPDPLDRIDSPSPA